MIEDGCYKNIVILGNNGTGIDAALKLSRLFKSHYNIKIHLIDNRLNLRNHLALKFFTRGLQETSSGNQLKKNLMYHRGTVTKVDLINRKIFFDGEEILFRFIVVDITNKNYYRFIQTDIRNSGKEERLKVDDFLRETDLPFVYVFGDNNFKRLDAGSFIPAVNPAEQKQEILIARNIFNEVYGYERIMQT